MLNLARSIGVMALGAMLSSCMGGTVPSGVPNGPTGLAAPAAAAKGVSRLGHGVRPAWSWMQGIFVSDGINGANDEVIAYKHCGGGLICTSQTFHFDLTSGPMGVWSDRQYLYVANGLLNTVTEYAANNTTAHFTYSAGIQAPVAVTTDRRHHVYVTNYNGFYSPSINEYKRNHNTLIAQCPAGFYGAGGIAVNHNGDVFVSYLDGAGGHLVKFAGGLAGCNATSLGFTYGSAPDLALDANQNLLVADYFGGAIDIIPPPYTSSGTFVSVPDPSSVRVNRQNNQALVASDFGQHVYLFAYPTGTLLQILGTSDGLAWPVAAVDWKNQAL